ncbi:MAG: hypothetical protein KBH33_06040 [Alicycliphilus sp.]|jgi:hypothetical protein|nr:hypothetical protein [Alicycliphilus sp.]TXJ07407.1 MAG: hypothetical protein E6Q29_10105 [Alicycliphilus sp.]
MTFFTLRPHCHGAHHAKPVFQQEVSMKHLVTAALCAAITLPAFATTRADAGPPDPARHVQCSGNRDAAQVDVLKKRPDGKLQFRISTAADTFHGVADPRNPRYSMEKQVLALGGQKYFCLHD